MTRKELRGLIEEKFNFNDLIQVEEIYVQTSDKMLDSKGQQIFTGIQPDILGEYFLIELFNNYVAEQRENEIIELCKITWDLSPNETWGTLMNLYQDYFIIEKKGIYKNIEKEQYEYLEKIIYENDLFLNMDSEQAPNASLLIFAIIYHLSRANNPKAKQIHLERLFEFQRKFPADHGVAYSLARSISVIVNNRTLSTELEITRIYLPKLEELASKFPNSPNIIEFLPESILSLTWRLGKENRGKIQSIYIPKLTILSERYKSNDRIAAKLAIVLFNYTTYLEEKECDIVRKSILPAIIKLQKKHPDNIDINISLAKCVANFLNNLAPEILFKERSEWFGVLTELVNQAARVEDLSVIVVQCLNTLNSLTTTITEDEVTEFFFPVISSIRYADAGLELATLVAKLISDILNKFLPGELTPHHDYLLERLQNLIYHYRKNEDFGVGLIGRIFKCGELSSWERFLNSRIVPQIKIILQAYGDTERIAVAVALLLNNLTINEDTASIEMIYLPWLRELAGKYSTEPNIARCDTAITYQLLKLQSESGKYLSRFDDLDYVESIVEKFPDSVEIMQFCVLIAGILLDKSDENLTPEIYNHILEVVIRGQRKFPDNGLIGHKLIRAYFTGIVIDGEKTGEYSEEIWKLFDQYEWYEPVKDMKAAAERMSDD